jgi:hypothetical protein
VAFASEPDERSLPMSDLDVWLQANDYGAWLRIEIHLTENGLDIPPWHTRKSRLEELRDELQKWEAAR